MAEPMISFSIDTREIEKFAASVPLLQEYLNDELDKAMTESGMLLTTMVAARTPVNYGLLRSAIQYPHGFEKSGVLDDLRGIVGASQEMSVSGAVTSDYVWYVENGTFPHFPPLAPLKLWAQRKFGDERIGYAIARKIAREGTRGAYMFTLGWYQGGRAQVTRLFRQAPVKALQRWETAVNSEGVNNGIR
jgi:hypothetical protein